MAVGDDQVEPAVLVEIGERRAPARIGSAVRSKAELPGPVSERTRLLSASISPRIQSVSCSLTK